MSQFSSPPRAPPATNAARFVGQPPAWWRRLSRRVFAESSAAYEAFPSFPLVHVVAAAGPQESRCYRACAAPPASREAKYVVGQTLQTTLLRTQRKNSCFLAPTAAPMISQKLITRRLRAGGLSARLTLVLAGRACPHEPMLPVVQPWRRNCTPCVPSWEAAGEDDCLSPTPPRGACDARDTGGSPTAGSVARTGYPVRPRVCPERRVTHPGSAEGA
jgi:hypothetical protein